MSGGICAVYGCSNYGVKNCTLSYFRFPKDAHLCKMWIIASRRLDLEEVFKIKGPEQLNKSYRICSDHFEINCFRNQKLFSQGLVRGAVPSLFLDGLGRTGSPTRPSAEKRCNETAAPDSTGPDVYTDADSDQSTSTRPNPKKGCHETAELDTAELDACDQSHLSTVSDSDEPIPVTPPAEERCCETASLEIVEANACDQSHSPTVCDYVLVPDAQLPIAKHSVGDLEAQVKALKHKLRNSQKVASKYRNKFTKLKKEHSLVKEKLNERSKLLDLLESSTDPHSSFFISQLKLSKQRKRGRRYNDFDKSFALDLHRCSPRAYNFMSKNFCLPDVRSLRKLRKIKHSTETSSMV